MENSTTKKLICIKTVNKIYFLIKKISNSYLFVEEKNKILAQKYLYAIFLNNVKNYFLSRR